MTNGAFGGDRLDVLYITSACVGLELTLAEQPHAGAVFAVEPGIIGLEPGLFAS